jgi:hypothetical protein
MTEELPKSLKLTCSKKKAAWMFIGCSVFVICGLFMTQEKETGIRIVGWIGVVFFGIGVLIGATAIVVPSSSYLQLDDKGLIMCSLFRKHFYRWDEIGELGIGSIFGHEMVMFNFSEKYKKVKAVRKLNKFISESDAGTPNHYGIQIGDLAELMIAFKNRYHLEQGKLLQS